MNKDSKVSKKLDMRCKERIKELERKNEEAQYECSKQQLRYMEALQKMEITYILIIPSIALLGFFIFSNS